MKHPGLGSGVAALLIAVVSWGGLFPAGKLVLVALDPYYLSAIRYGISVALFLAILAAMEGRAALRLEGRGAELAIFGAFGFAGFSLISFEGLRWTTPHQAAVIAATQPIVISVYQRFAHGVTFAPVTLVCLLAALAGCILVVTRGSLAALTEGGSAMGNALIFVGALCWIVYTFGAVRFRDWSPVRYTALSCAFGTLGIFAGTAVATGIGHAHVPTLDQVVSVAIPLGFMIVMASVVAVVAWNIGVHRLGPLNASLFGNFVPVVAFIIAAAQGYSVVTAEVIGAALVVGALLLNNLMLRRAPTAS